MQNAAAGPRPVCPYLVYEDAAGAVEYLTRTFGFVRRLMQTGGIGRTHAELVLGEDGLVLVGQAGESFKSPSGLDTALVYLHVDDVDALHERATAAGADVSSLATAPVGDRRFTATDPEGHVWVFAQRVD